MSKIFLSLLLFSLSFPIWANTEDPKVITKIDFSRYAGHWYEIAHAPNFFQKLCERSSAQYEIINASQVSVLNTCYRNNRVFTTINGVATVSDPLVPAKLKVDFGLFGRKGDYWIVDLAPDYSWAIVSGPKKNSLFILARSAPMKKELLQKLLLKLKKEGFKTESLVFDRYQYKHGQ